MIDDDDDDDDDDDGDEIVEQTVEWELAGETEVLGENRPSATLSTTNHT
jgi:hypothetical protein